MKKIHCDCDSSNFLENINMWILIDHNVSWCIGHFFILQRHFLSISRAKICYVVLCSMINTDVTNQMGRTIQWDDLVFKFQNKHLMTIYILTRKISTKREYVLFIFIGFLNKNSTCVIKPYLLVCKIVNYNYLTNT